MVLLKEFVLSLTKIKHNNIGFPTFKLPPSTKKYFMTNTLNM